VEGRKRRGNFCVVCRRQGYEQTGWFLVIENAWLDRLKILSWHPVLAEQSSMHSVCGKRHLDLLITHWLTYANLQFNVPRIPEFVLANPACGPADGLNLLPAGQLVGELFVLRDSLSRLWTGSSEARESIFEALSVACEERGSLPSVSAPKVDSMPENLVTVPTRAGERLSEYSVS
jgi:hypothetical protein